MTKEMQGTPTSRQSCFRTFSDATLNRCKSENSLPKPEARISKCSDGGVSPDGLRFQTPQKCDAFQACTTEKEVVVKSSCIGTSSFEFIHGVSLFYPPSVAEINDLSMEVMLEKELFSIPII
jgi:hypothetical protein